MGLFFKIKKFGSERFETLGKDRRLQPPVSLANQNPVHSGSERVRAGQRNGYFSPCSEMTWAVARPNFLKMGACKFAQRCSRSRSRSCTMGRSSPHISNSRVNLKALTLHSTIWLSRLQSCTRCCSWLASCSFALESRRPTPSQHTTARPNSQKRRL